MNVKNKTDKKYDKNNLVKTCYCGSKNFLLENGSGPHYLEQKCTDCGKTLKFIGKNKKNPNRNNTSDYNINQVSVVKRQNIYEENQKCFFCGRTKDMLGRNETLELDHITPFNSGGEDRPENIQILCTACHKLKHHCRTYMNIHFKSK